MPQNSKPVVFFGSGPVAAKSLKHLAKIFYIEAVITKPRAPHHKGPVPVLDLADNLGLRVELAADKQQLDYLFAHRPFMSDVGILVDFGIIVSQKVIDYFPLGIINSHFSLLPKLRGADPISFAILSGESETGVSLMLLVKKMDAGPLIAQAPFQIPPDCTTPSLTKALIDISDQTLAAMIPEYIAGRLQPVPQDQSVKPTYSRKLTKDAGLIDWHKPAVHLEREVRAYSEWPKSRCELAGQEIIITKAKTVSQSAKPGQVMASGNKLIVACGQQSLEILELKPAGKPAMNATAFLAGYGSRLRS